MTAPPVRRRPGRPRKHPLPETPAPSTEETGPKEGAEPPPSDPKDPRIGEECHPDATQVGFDDGSVYEAKGGFLVKRVD